MPDPIQHPGLPRLGPIDRSPAGASSPAEGAAGAQEHRDFKSILLESLDEVNRLQQEAARGIEQLMTGQNVSVAEVFTAVRKADVAFSLLMEIRNKLQDAYRDLQQMRV